MNIPAIDSLNSEASVPAATARSPKRAVTERRFGATAPRPPSKIAIELKLSNQHNAKQTTITVLGDKSGILMQMKNRQQIHSLQF